MAFHHVAVATRDTEANHRFYTDATGFELVKVEVAKTPAGGWAKHLFYETGGGQMIAFWELHDDSFPQPTPTAISTALGLPEFVNHIAFHAADLSEIEKHKQRWLDHGHDVMEIDHEWCWSIYTMDPNGILVEFCTMTRALGAKDREEALRLMRESAPAIPTGGKAPLFHKAAASGARSEP
jgi:catechol 2,3-dioxygenase-like lactoylglutathione lyase family enzyme